MDAIPAVGPQRGVWSLLRRLHGRYVARREHDAAMRDHRIAAEHAFDVAYVTSRGEPGCEFCR